MESEDQPVAGQGRSPAGEAEEDRRAVLAQLSHLDELTPADEEEIDRFRSFTAAPVRSGTGLGRMVGQFRLGHRRIAS